MNERTGEIRFMPPEMADELNRALRELGKQPEWRDISDIDEDTRLKLQGMNRADRRAFFKKRK